MISHRPEETLDFTVWLQSLEDPKRRDDQVKTLSKVQICDVRLLGTRSRGRDPVLRQFLPAEREHSPGDIYTEDIAALLNKRKQDTASTAAQPQNSRRGRREPLLIEWDIVGKFRAEVVVTSCIFADVRSHYRLGAPDGIELRCAAEAGSPSPLFSTRAGQASFNHGPARRVSFPGPRPDGPGQAAARAGSELLGGVSLMRRMT